MKSEEEESKKSILSALRCLLHTQNVEREECKKFLHIFAVIDINEDQLMLEPQVV
jgi:hypothetical protein